MSNITDTLVQDPQSCIDLKELGFDGECDYSFYRNLEGNYHLSRHDESVKNSTWHDGENDPNATAFTYAQIFEGTQDEYGLHTSIRPLYPATENYAYGLVITSRKEEQIVIDAFPSRREAKEAAVKAIINYIKENEN